MAGDLPLDTSKKTLPALLRVAYVVVGHGSGAQETPEAPATAVRRLTDVLDRAMDRISAAAPEDWGICADLTEGADIDSSLVLACVEAAVELAVLETARRESPRLAPRTTSTRAKRVVALLGLHRRLALLRSGGENDRKQTKDCAACPQEHGNGSELSPEFVALLLNGIVDDGLEPDDSEVEDGDDASECPAVRAILRDGTTQVYAFECAEAVAESANRAWTSCEPGARTSL